MSLMFKTLLHFAIYSYFAWSVAFFEHIKIDKNLRFDMLPISVQGLKAKPGSKCFWKKKQIDPSGIHPSF